MTAIIDEILKNLPENAQISETIFEGANIILYTKSREFFLNQHDVIRNIVSIIKKRVELRPDPAIAVDPENAEPIIRKIIPEDAGITKIIFDIPRSIVVIDAERPGIAIGKQGELLREIKQQVYWVPFIQRTPALRSQIIENIHQVLYENNDYRKKFLDKVGHRIYDGWLRGEKKQEWIRLTVLGAGRHVGRSCMFLQTPESRILIDCGINVAASEPDCYPQLDTPEFRLEELDAVVLSHSHIDHGGFIPYLYKMGYRGPVYCTAPTRDVTALLTLDFIGVAFKQAKRALYTAADIREMVKHTICLEYGEVTDITPDIRLTFYNAGHILGSSMAHLHIGNGLHNFLYSGDFKYVRTALLEPAESKFPRLETVMMESTYGAKTDVLMPRKEAEEALISAIKETIERSGKALIPVLGVGRAQEIMLILEEAIRTGKLMKVPVYVHGMVWDVTAIHTAYPDFLNRNIRKAIFHKDENPFLSDIFKRVGSKKEQDQIINDEGPCIILATAGFLNAGASLEYFKALAHNPRNTIIFVSYQYEGSIGRRVQGGDREVQIPNSGERPEIIKVNMAVKSISSLTGHAGRNELMRFIHDVSPRPKKIIINHGEASKCLDLASSLYKMAHIETIAPRNLDSMRLL